MTSFQQIVRDYIRRFQRRAQEEIRFYANRANLETAVRFAALCIEPDGKRHPHQRARTTVLQEAERRLQLAAKEIKSARNFAELHSVVESEIISEL